MNWTEFLIATQLQKRIKVTLIKPLRNPHYEGDICFTFGYLTGFKSGLFGGGFSQWKNGMPMSYNSTKRHWIRRPKVHITYTAFEYHGKEYSDWIDVSNCIFEIEEQTDN